MHEMLVRFVVLFMHEYLHTLLAPRATLSVVSMFILPSYTQDYRACTELPRIMDTWKVRESFKKELSGKPVKVRES